MVYVSLKSNLEPVPAGRRRAAGAEARAPEAFAA
jgi:hypothetical protein